MGMSVVLSWTLISVIVSSQAEVYFEQNFDGSNPLNGWVIPESKDVTLGKFEISAKKYSTDSTDLGLKTVEDTRFYWISKKFKSATNKNKNFVAQFSVSFEQDIDCGGGYIKLYSSETDQSKVHDKTPYYIMFGPDICGPSRRLIHAILNYNETNLDCLSSLKCKDDVFTHVYTLILKPDKTFVVKTDNKETKFGKLEDEWNFLPPKKIKDPEATKPENWDDREMIDNPNDKQPADWVQPEFIKDEKAVKPDDWNADEDGEWEAPMIDNPKYRGEWKPSPMKNPDYKGAWSHPMIDNPDYKKDDKIGIYEDIGLLGIDVWQVKSGTVFDNFLITDDVDYAEEQAKKIIDKAESEQTVKKNLDEEKMKNDESAHKESSDDEKLDSADDLIDEESDDLNVTEDEHTTSDDPPSKFGSSSSHPHEEL